MSLRPGSLLSRSQSLAGAPAERSKLLDPSRRSLAPMNEAARPVVSTQIPSPLATRSRDPQRHLPSKRQLWNLKATFRIQPGANGSINGSHARTVTSTGVKQAARFWASVTGWRTCITLRSSCGISRFFHFGSSASGRAPRGKVHFWIPAPG